MHHNLICSHHKTLIVIVTVNKFPWLYHINDSGLKYSCAQFKINYSQSLLLLQFSRSDFYMSVITLRDHLFSPYLFSPYHPNSIKNRQFSVLQSMMHRDIFPSIWMFNWWWWRWRWWWWYMTMMWNSSWYSFVGNTTKNTKMGEDL